MNNNYLYFFILLLLLPIPLLGQGSSHVLPSAQAARSDSLRPAAAPSTDPNAIRLINSDYGTFYLIDDNTVNVVVGQVIFEHKGDRLYADSARLNVTSNTLHAYKNVRIVQQDGTICYADYMYYNGNTDMVELKGSVQIVSNMDNLWSDKIIYNMRTNIGYYDAGGVLQTGVTIISSRYAQYNGNTYDARFKGNVNVEDPEYLIVSSDMNYNTDSRVAHFYGPSIIKSDSTILYTTDGYYDTHHEIAQFNKRSSILAQKQYIEADTMDYNKKTGLGIGRSNVVLLDSARKMNIYGQYATLNEITGQALVTRDPFAVMYDDADTTWILADTFFTEPVRNLELYISFPEHMSAQDSLIYTLDILRRSVEENDSAGVDSIGVPETDTLISSDSYSLSGGASDTLSQADSVLTTDPISSPADTPETINDTTELTDFITPDTSSMSVTGRDSLIQLMDSLIFAGHSDSLQRNDSGMISVDSVLSSHDLLQENMLASDVPVQDSAEVEEPRYLVAYSNVFIYNDSFQAKCDSLRYSQQDTLLVFYKDPVLWSQEQQVLGDVIEAFVDSSRIQYVHIPRNGILIAQSTKQNELMFDQIQANDIWAYFGNNELDSVIGRGNAQTIYYAADDQNRYIGVSKASSMHLKMLFEPEDSLNEKRRLSDIIYYTDHEQEMTPMGQANISSMKLSRFRWRAPEKLPSKDAFLQLLKSRQYSSSLREDIADSIQEDKEK